MEATALVVLDASSLSLEHILEAYNVQITERRSDLEQLQEVRACMQQAHTVTTKKKQAYLVHLNRQMKSRMQRCGSDLTSYSRVMERCYSNSCTGTPTSKSSVHQQGEIDSRRPVNDVIRRQSMLISVMHQCEVQQNLVALSYTQNKIFAESLMKEVSDMEDEKAQLQAVFSKRRQEREEEMQEEKERILTTMIDPQRMVVNKLSELLGEVTLEEKMIARRARQSKGIQHSLKQRSENFRKMRQKSFEKANQHRRRSIGSQGGGGGGLPEDIVDFLDDDRSVGSNKSGWSAKSGPSARSGWSGRSGKSNKSGKVSIGGGGILGLIFGRTSSTTLESETAPSPMMEISIRKIPPSSAFIFMSGLGDEIMGDDDFISTEPTTSSVDS